MINPWERECGNCTQWGQFDPRWGRVPGAKVSVCPYCSDHQVVPLSELELLTVLAAREEVLISKGDGSWIVSMYLDGWGCCDYSVVGSDLLPLLKDALIKDLGGMVNSVECPDCHAAPWSECQNWENYFPWSAHKGRKEAYASICG